ncbi:hypothetical protein MMC07_005807 [Pseudocyphellaria aurata]|nr:hypothetical protein [Pseudocyphellaria aurata]
MTDQTCNNGPDDLFESIDLDLELDESIDPVLSSPSNKKKGNKDNDENDESIPPEMIAAEVRSTRFIAALERPIRLGTFNDQTAFLLTFHFSFQRTFEGSFNRVRAVEIKIVFEDAPRDQTVGAGRNPSIVRLHPVEYDGPATYGNAMYSSGIHSELISIPGGPSLGAHLSRDVNVPIVSSLNVHGTRSGTPTRNKVVWTIEENSILKTGMPREVKLSLIVNMKELRRFSARVIVAAHYSFMYGLLAKTFPVIGRSNNPLFFDPPLLEDIARNQGTGPDGGPITMLVGSLDDDLLDGSEYSSWPSRP